MASGQLDANHASAVLKGPYTASVTRAADSAVAALEPLVIAVTGASRGTGVTQSVGSASATGTLRTVNKELGHA